MNLSLIHSLVGVEEVNDPVKWGVIFRMILLFGNDKITTLLLRQEVDSQII